MRPLRKPKGPYLLGLTTIGLAFTLLGLFLLAVKNLEGMVGRWREGIQMVCYLKPGLGGSEVEGVIEALRGEEVVGDVEYLPPQRVKEEFLRDFSGLIQGMEDLQEDLFPPVLLVSLKVPLPPGDLRALSQRMGAIPGVEEVQYGGRWLEKALQVIGVMRTATWVLGGILLGITLLISTNTLRLLFYQRKEEVEILRLMGATEGFIRAPFIGDGILQGFLGALLALFLSWLCFVVVQQKLPQWLLAYLPRMEFLSPWEALVLVGLGVLSGTLGGYWACSGRA